jgi:hypothetical protein
MRGMKTMAGLRIVAAGHAFVQNLRRGHYEIAVDLVRPLSRIVIDLCSSKASRRSHGTASP